MDVDATEGFQHQEEEEVLVVCENWARSGKCRYSGAGQTCKSGYHPPKETDASVAVKHAALAHAAS
jgi:hypothetical protein